MFNLESGEKIHIILRRHWLILAFNLASAAVLVTLGIIAYLFLQNASFPTENFPFLAAANSWKTFLPVLFGVYLLMMWSFIFTVLVDYYLDVWVITDKRVIDIEQKGLFNREISEFPLTRVQDVTVNVKGILATIFSYGNIHVQTAGEHREFVFKEVPDPSYAKDLILKLSHFSSPPADNGGETK